MAELRFPASPYALLAFCVFVAAVMAGCGVTAPAVLERTSAHFLERRGALIAADTVRIDEGVWEVRLRSDSGLDFLARVTIPDPAVAPEEGYTDREARGLLPGAVLTGGFDTGRRAADLVPEGTAAVVISPEYPEVVVEARVLADTDRMRELSVEHIARLLLCAEYLLSRDDIDPERLALIGVSFGGFYAPPAAVAEPRFRNVALMYAGADLSLLIANRLEEVIPVPAATLAGEIMSLHLQLIEPLRWVGAISPRPLLFVNGIHDEMIPPKSSSRLHRAAEPPIDVIWLPTDHLRPGAGGLAGELVDTAFARLPVLREY